MGGPALQGPRCFARYRAAEARGRGQTAQGRPSRRSRPRAGRTRRCAAPSTMIVAGQRSPPATTRASSSRPSFYVASGSLVLSQIAARPVTRGAINGAVPRDRRQRDGAVPLRGARVVRRGRRAPTGSISARPYRVGAREQSSPLLAADHGSRATRERGATAGGGPPAGSTTARRTAAPGPRVETMAKSRTASSGDRVVRRLQPGGGESEDSGNRRPRWSDQGRAWRRDSQRPLRRGVNILSQTANWAGTTGNRTAAPEVRLTPGPDLRQSSSTVTATSR